MIDPISEEELKRSQLRKQIQEYQEAMDTQEKEKPTKTGSLMGKMIKKVNPDPTSNLLKTS
jgi:hypothetical protein